MRQTDKAKLIEDVARIIAPMAFECFDNLTPTEREMWDKKRQRLLTDARKQAKQVIRRVISDASLIALEQRCERGTPWDRACVSIAGHIKEYAP